MVRTTPLMLLLAGCATAPAALDPAEVAAVKSEAAPDREAGIAMIESTIRNSLKDPDSAQFVWPNDFVQGWYQRPFGKRYYGWITCGTVNAKNSYGGYAGRTAAVGVIRSGVVVEANIDEPNSSFVAEACQKIGAPVG